MKSKDIALGVLVAAIWGFNFIPIHYSLESFPPFTLVALRFLVAALPVFFLPRPDLPLWRLFVISIPLFLGQYILMFSGMKAGMPPGITSITIQVQFVFTMLIGWWMLKEKPSLPQIIGGAVSLAGLGFIASTIGGDVTLIGLVLVTTAAASWAMGNVLLRQTPQQNILAFIVWMCAAAAPGALLLALLVDGPNTMINAIQHAHFAGWLSLGFISLISTLVGFGLWGFLLRHYPAGKVAPLALLVPVFGGLSAHLAFGETFAPLRLAGMALIMIGLAVTMLRKPVRGLPD